MFSSCDSLCSPAVANGNSYKQCRVRRFIRFPGDRVTRKYQRAAVRRAEYKKLKAIVPSVAGKRTVSKLTVVEEAIRYIDELHSMLAERMCGTNRRDRTTDAIVRQRCHQQFVDDVIQPNVFLSTVCSSLPALRQEQADFEYEFVLSSDDVTSESSRKHRRTLNELQLFASNFGDVTHY